MTGKFHYYYPETEKNMPKELVYEHRANMEYGAIDGYIRPRCTSIIPLVDCFYCRQEMKKKGIIK